MKAVLYARVSTGEQADNYSIPTQKEAIYKYASEHDLEIVREFVEPGFTASDLDRPTLTELREFVGAGGVEAVIVYDQDRLARNLVGQMILANEFEKQGVKLIFVTYPLGTSPEDKMLFGMKGLFAEYEITKTLERTKRGRLARIKQGKLAHGGGSNLYGYLYQPESGTRVRNEDESKIVSSIFAWYVEENLTIRRLALRLKGLEILSPSGNPYWGRGTLQKLLKNQCYAGKTFAFTEKRTETETHYKPKRKGKKTSVAKRPFDEWLEIPDATPAIISEELFNKAQAKLKRNKELASRNAKRQYLLSGYLFCNQCGRRYAGGTRSNKTKNGINHHPFYHCTRDSRGEVFSPCHNRTWSARNLEAIVWQEIYSVLLNPDIVLAGLEAIRNEGEDISLLEIELQNLEAHLRELDKEQRDLLDNALRGFPKSLIVSENKRINQSRAELERHYADLNNKITQVKQAKFDIQGIERACGVVKSNLRKLTFEDKRLALEALEIKVWVDKDSVSIEGAIPATIENTTSSCRGQNITQAFPFKIPVTVGVK